MSIKEIFPLRGPTGPAGADGTIGVDGATGPTGPTGPSPVTGSIGEWVQLTSADPTEILAQQIGPFGANKSLITTLGVRVDIKPNLTASATSEFDCRVGTYIKTGPNSAVTASFQTSPFFDYSLIHPSLSTMSASLTPMTGGFVVSVTRPTDILCSASARWWVVDFRDITD